MKDIKAKAEGIAALGRGNDSVAVHMSQNEVRALQKIAKLHGGTLTRNPKTGMVECGFLESILPTIAGAATMYFLPGAGAMGAALAGGATSALTNRRAGLTGIAMGALGGYGGGSMYNTIAGLGSSAAGLEAIGGQAGLDAAMGANAAQTSFGDFAPMAVDSPIAPSPSGGYGMSDGASGGASPIDQGAPPAQVGANPHAPASPMNIPTTTHTPDLSKSNFTRGLGSLIDSPMQLLKSNGAWDKDKLIAAAAAVAPMVNYAMTPNTLSGSAAASQRTPMIRPYSYNQSVNPRFGELGQPYFTQEYTAGVPYAAAAGGQIGGDYPAGYAHGGRLLDGPGTGLSDSIPASINGKQPAALADGEFVVSADVVGALGGGSTKSGAKKLYAMMDRVRKQAHGTKKQIRPISDSRVLPA